LPQPHTSGDGGRYAITTLRNVFAEQICKENEMGKGNNSQKNDKKSKKPKQDKKKAPVKK
jgi:hypothetical protein